MKIVSVIGARPQFIKAAPVCWAFRRHHTEVLVHTGQHYDANMSEVFFEEMEIPPPEYNLGIGSGSHAAQTGRMLMAIEDVLVKERPDGVLVYGDTNSTMAGALAACKLHLPVAHVEAGLRSFNREMPEEHNRVLTDHCADLLFCPTQTAVEQLAREGIRAGVHRVGDTMYDAVLHFSKRAEKTSSILEDLALEPGHYFLATMHRPYNTDVPANLNSILEAFKRLDDPVVFPAHPRTRDRLGKWGPHGLVKVIDPLGYLDMLVLEQHARAILTDSGGMQKEAYFFAVPCVTLRPETEWVETLASGWNVVVGADSDRIVEAAARPRPVGGPPPPVFGDGQASVAIVDILAASLAPASVD